MEQAFREGSRVIHQTRLVVVGCFPTVGKHRNTTDPTSRWGHVGCQFFFWFWGGVHRVKFDKTKATVVVGIPIEE